jgi:hypothetical protein
MCGLLARRWFSGSELTPFVLVTCLDAKRPYSTTRGIVMSKALVLGAAALVFSAAGALAADLVAPGYGYAAPGYVAPAPVYTAPPAYAAPVYTAPPIYAAPIYTAPPVYAAPQVYTAPAVTTGYYASHPVPPEPIPGPIYDYAAGSGYEYTAPGYWNRSYWGRGYGFEWR